MASHDVNVDVNVELNNLGDYQSEYDNSDDEMETLGGSDEEYNNLLKMSKRPHGVDHKMNFKKLKWQVAI